MANPHRTFSHAQFQDLTGQQFGKLTFVRPLGKNRWVVKCECGNETTAWAANVKKGATISCGCVRRRGAVKNPIPAGMRHEYFTIKNMLRRCAADTEPEFSSYKAKGIKVCDRWANSLEAFVEDMGRHPGKGYTIERKDNSKGYEPGNCVWATMHAQSRNRKGNHFITHDGTTMVLTDWAKHLGISEKLLSRRLNRGWSVDRALTAPVMACMRRDGSDLAARNATRKGQVGGRLHPAD